MVDRDVALQRLYICLNDENLCLGYDPDIQLCIRQVCKSAFCSFVGKGTHVKGKIPNLSPFPDFCKKSILYMALV
ncbi:hypothetical protein NIES25_43250 [Nostoc linckia NIES-25]|nr:hypothetical protein NIES25_43250 [Nostoc linckia NIES-25]